jgi:hypothetical protein
LALYCAIVVLVGITSSYLAYLNRDHSRRRVKAGKDAVIIDYSLYSAEEADRLRRTHAADRAESAATSEETGARAFADLTDLQNDEFIFVF